MLQHNERMPSCSRLRYLESHPRTSGTWPADRPPLGTLVLLHAFPLSARLWEPQYALADAGWRVVMPQLRGFDCTTPDGADVHSVDDYANDVADLMQTLELERAVIGGLSLGGYVAFALYRQAPALFQALILADTRAEADSAEARINRTRLIDVVRTRGAAAVADEMVPKLLGATSQSARPELLDRVRSLILGNPPSAIEGALTAMMARPDSTMLLPSITVPTLVVVGDEDLLTPRALSTAMASLLPIAELAVLPQAGHLSNLEQPDAFNAALLRFLDRL